MKMKRFAKSEKRKCKVLQKTYKMKSENEKFCENEK